MMRKSLLGRGECQLIMNPQSLIVVLIMSIRPTKKTANTTSLIDSFIHWLVGWLVG
jgi:hypothetical protein